MTRRVLKLLRAMLRAGVMEDGQVRRPVTGTPQGGVVSPLLANVYLHRLDRAWDVGEHGVLVRYADDLVVMCGSRQQAEAALARLTVLLADLGLEPKAAKTRIVHLEVGGEGFDFLGFHHRLVRSRVDVGKRGRHLPGPLALAQGHAARPDRIRELTVRSRLLLPVERDREEVNRFLRGWAAYFRYGNSARPLRQDQGVRADAAGAVHRQASPPQPGVRLVRASASPPEPARPDRPARNRRRTQALPGLAGRGHRMPAVNDVGEPCAGEPHARFDGRGLETERTASPRHDSGRRGGRPR